MHYNGGGSGNATTDSSGFRLVVSSSLRPYDLGVLMVMKLGVEGLWDRTYIGDGSWELRDGPYTLSRSAFGVLLQPGQEWVVVGPEG